MREYAAGACGCRQVNEETVKPARPVFKHLATLVAAIGVAAPAASRLDLPSDLIVEAIEELVDPEVQADDRKRVLGFLAGDPRPSVRASAAEATHLIWPSAPAEGNRLLRMLARDASDEVRAAVGTGIDRILRVVSPADRIVLVADWTMSEVPEARSAIAAALRAPTSILVADLAIEQLAKDPVSSVRRFALEAALQRWDENVSTYGRLTVRLATDPVRGIRRLARRTLARMQSGRLPRRSA